MTIGQPYIPMRILKKFAPIPLSLLKCSGLSSTAKLCFAVLALHAGQDGKCFPSQATLAAELGMSVSQVKRVLKELEEQGFIKKKHPRGIDRLSHKSVRYQFLWNAVFEDDAKGSTKEPSQGVASGTPRRIAREPSREFVNDLSKEKEKQKKEKKAKKEERDAVKTTASSLSSSLSSPEIKKTAEKQVNDIIRKKAQVLAKNRVDCEHMHCEKYFACIKKKEHHSIMSNCSVLIDHFITSLVGTRKKLLAETIDALEEKNITDPVQKAKLILEHFNVSALERREIKYLSKASDQEAVNKFIKLPDKPNYKRLIEFYLNPIKCKKSERQISLSTCLSEDTINMYNINRKGSFY